jgi:hypothetical protein
MHIVKGLRILNSTQTVAMTGFGVVGGPNNPHFFNIRIDETIKSTHHFRIGAPYLTIYTKLFDL